MPDENLFNENEILIQETEEGGQNLTEKEQNTRQATSEEFIEKIKKIASEKHMGLSFRDGQLQIGKIQFIYSTHKYTDAYKKESGTGINSFLKYLMEYDTSDIPNGIYTNSQKDELNRKIFQTWCKENNFYYTSNLRNGYYKLDGIIVFYKELKVFEKGKILGQGTDVIEDVFSFLNPSVSIKEIEDRIK